MEKTTPRTSREELIEQAEAQLALAREVKSAGGDVREILATLRMMMADIRAIDERNAVKSDIANEIANEIAEASARG